MGRKWLYAVYVYAAGALITFVWQVWSAYENGGFERPHSFGDLVLIAVFYSVAAALWPLLAVTTILMKFGFLPRIIDLF